MANINIKKAFTMPVDEVRKGIEKMAASLKKEQGMSYAWVSEDRVEFSHKTGKGSLAIEGGELVMQLKIGLLYSAVAPMVKQKIQNYADKHIH
jgi:putative polyhydroxyalkanoate system protein